MELITNGCAASKMERREMGKRRGLEKGLGRAEGLRAKMEIKLLKELCSRVVGAEFEGK